MNKLEHQKPLGNTGLVNGLLLFCLTGLCKTVNNWEMEGDASSSHSRLPTTLYDPSAKCGAEGREAAPLVSHLLREEKPVPKARSTSWGGWHFYLGIAGTAEGQEELGDLAGRAGCLRMVLHSL